ncbi:hypothetical protein [Sphingomonas sp. PAMC 26617]|uniref:hypothetical protein n=1 Tax=Sphingomonas sp. PAMC 26617 TaxID=1112216 RepID=UPI001E432930|nr:hypothetical protein [Sphingomonas sp. PAMC 26617]
MADDVSRRGLLELGIGAALATPALTMAVPARAQRREPDSVGVAVVGLGKLSQGQILPALKRRKGEGQKTVIVRNSAMTHPELSGYHGLASTSIICGGVNWTMRTLEQIVRYTTIAFVLPGWAKGLSPLEVWCCRRRGGPRLS